VATALLQQLALDKRNPDSEQAIFWLGELRGEAGFEALKSLLEELPHGSLRRHINFSLAQSDVDAAENLLFELAEHDSDPEQRSDALFWLAEEFPEKAESFLLSVLQNNDDEDMTEQAVFAISQLPSERSGKILLEIARSPEHSRSVRKQAMFWLAQSDKDADIEALTELLIR
jgi:HEAT repeat protein